MAGHRGMVGAAIVRRLQGEDCQLLTASRDQLDLLREEAVDDWFAGHKPDAVFLAAAKVGGILANDTYPVAFLEENLKIQTNVISAAHRHAVEKLVFLGSSCIYPRDAPQPIPEDALLTGPLEPTNQWYAIAKIAGIKLCQAYRKEFGRDFVSAMPTNLYGPNDNFDLQTSHVLPALMRKIHDAKQSRAEEFEIWGSGKPMREFLHVDDCADALVFILKHYSQDGHINVGSGSEISIADLARMISDAVGYEGRMRRDLAKPDGTPRKLMDNRKLSALGWQPHISLEQGLAQTYAWYLQHNVHGAGSTA